MSTKDFTADTMFLLQTTLGILGNFSLLGHNLFLSFSGSTFRSKDFIISHLTIGNSMVILAKGIPQTLSLFGYQRFLNEFGCKGLAYVHRVGRGVSIGCTCVLSVFQAITISPGTPKWAELKVRAPLFIGVSIFLCWILSMQLHIITIVFVTIEWRNDSIAEWREYGFCYMVCPDRTAALFYAALLAVPDAMCLVLMLLTSGSMVLLLYRHKQRMRHIYRNSTSPRSYAETKATQTIITLVSTFVSFYTLSVILNGFMNVASHPTQSLLTMCGISAAFYPTLSPFILMRCKFSASSLFIASMRKVKSPHSVRNT